MVYQQNALSNSVFPSYSLTQYTLGALRRDIINDYPLLMANQGYLFDDGNFVIKDDVGTVLWETNTHDRYHPTGVEGVRFKHTTLSPDQVVVLSHNGRYLLFVDQGRQTWSLHDMTFNNPKVVDFVTAHETELSLLIKGNHGFCWNHLWKQGAEFLDDRCHCFTDPLLVEDVLHIDLKYLISKDQTLLMDLFPCLSPLCVAVSASREKSIAVKVHEYKCTEVDVTVCTVLMNLKNANVSTDIVQTCGKFIPSGPAGPSSTTDTVDIWLVVGIVTGIIVGIVVISIIIAGVVRYLKRRRNLPPMEMGKI